MKSMNLLFTGKLKKADSLNCFLLSFVLTILALFPVINISGQSTMFYDDFNRASLSSTSMTYTWTHISSVTTPIIESVTATGTVPYLKVVSYLSSTATAGQTYLTGPVSSFASQFNPILSSNAGVVTWSVNMRENQGTMSGLASGKRFIGVVLCATEADLLSATCKGYMISQGTTTTSGYQLVKFDAGLGFTATTTTIITGPTLASSKDWMSVKVTYDPATNNWSLYERTDGPSASAAWADPSTTNTQIGAATSDVSYVGSAMSVFGFFANVAASSTAFNCQFDNFKVQVNLPVTYTVNWPKAENATPSGFTAKVNTNVAGKSYYVVLANGATAPTSAQIKAGKDASDVAVTASGTIVCVSGATEYAAAVTGLSGLTNYDVYFVAEDVSGSNLQASPVKVTVTTTAAATAPLIQDPTTANILNNSADLGGNITSDGGSALLERGTVWNTTTGVKIDNNKLAEGGTTTGIFAQNRSGLPSKTQIFYKGYATNAVGTTLSTEGSFYTLADEPTDQVINLTAVLTPGATDSSIDLSWTPAASASGYLILYKKGSTTAPTGRPTDANVYTVGSSIGNGIVAADVTSGSATSQTVNGLTASSTYAYVVIAYNSDGINAGTYNYFLTSAPTVSAVTDLGTSISGNNTQSAKAYVSNGKLVVFGGDVYNSIGMKVASVKVNSGKTILTLRPDFYVIKTANKIQKILVR